MPDVWQRASSTSWYDQSDLGISGKEIESALDRLLQSEHLQYFRICFFLDGLDEYEPTPLYDHKYMVNMLNERHERAPGSIKACVSSREDPVFMNNLDADRRIRLNEVTELDVRRYVRNRLGHVAEKWRAELVKEIASKAHGIFLWVTLAVKEVRNQIENGTRLQDLVRYVDSLPRELNDLFRQLIDSVHPVCRKLAYQVFEVARLQIARLQIARLQTVHGPVMQKYALALVSAPFLEEYARDLEFAFLETPSPDSRRLDYIDAEKKLNGWCKGLIKK